MHIGIEGLVYDSHNSTHVRFLYAHYVHNATVQQLQCTYSNNSIDDVSYHSLHRRAIAS